MAVLHFLAPSFCLPLVLSIFLSSEFRLKGTDSALEIVTYDSYSVSNKWGCLLKCQRNIFCLSVNLFPSGGNLTCQENFERVDVSGVWFTPKPGTSYFERMENPASPYADVTSAGYDPIDSDLYVTCGNVLFQFTDVANMGKVGPTVSLKLTVSITTLRYLPESPAKEAWFHAYIDDGRVMKMKFTRGQFSSTIQFTAVGTIETIHAQSLIITDILTYNQITYVISDASIFRLGDALEVADKALLRDDAVSWNIFKNAPTELTAATEANSNYVIFFKGNRFMNYDVTSSTVVSAGILLYKLQ
ncbi:hypothetical protein CAPTEDRAFT_197368 [Capitella teleta]|uniref:Apple domain-containing protein n=1 Tax=Capitella teleta TaxID=283909 RepID=R7TPV4_CAPTE|nr:hypothetical protein CAPTEDRAFT_197368 [Capitella teleta]|eukprot:ELT95689.1 hypothetical protein CAPTEDRAFT_197368 [Capitella teleta]